MRKIQKTIPKTPKYQDEIINDLLQLDKKYNFFNIVETINYSVKHINNFNQCKKENVFYLLTLESKGNIVEIVKCDKEKANIEYLRREKIEEKENKNVVLVSANSIENLKQAYPNYFTNIEDFYYNIEDLFTKITRCYHEI